MANVAFIVGLAVFFDSLGSRTVFQGEASSCENRDAWLTASVLALCFMANISVEEAK